MDGNKVYSRSEFCNLCLGHEERLLHDYCILNENLKSLLQESTLTLCQYCKRLFYRFVQLLQNLENVQRLVDEYDVIDLSSARQSFQPAISLSEKHLGCLESGSEGDNEGNLVGHFLVCQTHGWENVPIKHEVKEENLNEFLNDLDDEYVDDDEISDPTFEIKDEQDLNQLIKKEVEADIIDLKCLKKKLKKEKKHKRKHKFLEATVTIKKESSKNITKKASYAEVVRINKEKCLEERLTEAQDPKYLNSPLKCEDCIKGFLFKSTYDSHMINHKESSGKYKCEICKQRKDTAEKLRKHKKYHVLRYRCTECSLLRKTRRTIEEHFNTVHYPLTTYLPCPHCSKGYKSKVSLVKHIRYAHRGAGGGEDRARATCDYCQGTYATKEVLRAHLITKHSQEIAVEKPRLTHVCSTCGKGFKSPSHLKKHVIMHTDKKDYYCVECDKSFKSDSILKHHLKTATPHVNYLELPFPCLDESCEKRFSIRRDLDRHMNSMHLHVKPYQCDKCERGYASSWSLMDHKRLIHEGYKRPLKFPCTMCDKVFDRNQILKSHIRTHTGERPYQCTKCPANFSQSSVLRTHVKLIHLKLTRDGTAKPQR